MKVTEIRSTDVTAAFAAFVSACADGELAHIGQPELDAALNGAARRPVADAYAWSRRSSGVDISALCAVTIAHWAAATRSERRPRFVTDLGEVLAKIRAEGRLPPEPPAHLVFPRYPQNPLGSSVPGPVSLPDRPLT